MKINKYLYIVILFMTPLFWSCEKETEGISTTTYYPTITLNGERWNTVPVGGAFTDQGATAQTSAGTPVEVVVAGDQVDTNTPGVYVIEYTATNPEGFSVLERRYVGVIAPDAAANDLTGNYQRNAGAKGISHVTKVADGFYHSDNIGGTAANIAVGVYFYNTTGTTVICPVQVVGGSEFSAINITWTPGVSYSWVVINGGYGLAVRTFVKI